MADLGPGREAVRWGIGPVVRWGVRAVALAGAGLGLWTFSQGTDEERARNRERQQTIEELQRQANTERDQVSTRGGLTERQERRAVDNGGVRNEAEIERLQREQARLHPQQTEQERIAAAEAIRNAERARLDREAREARERREREPAAAPPATPQPRTESDGVSLIGANSQIRPFVQRGNATNRFGQLIVEVRPDAPIVAEGNRVNITVTTINGVTQTIPGTLGVGPRGRPEVTVALDAATAPLVRDMREVTAPMRGTNGAPTARSTVDVDDGIREQRIRPNIPAPN